jgi:hypothetical protein
MDTVSIALIDTDDNGTRGMAADELTALGVSPRTVRPTLYTSKPTLDRELLKRIIAAANDALGTAMAEYRTLLPNRGNGRGNRLMKFEVHVALAVRHVRLVVSLDVALRIMPDRVDEARTIMQHVANRAAWAALPLLEHFASIDMGPAYIHCAADVRRDFEDDIRELVRGLDSRTTDRAAQKR